jgi:hypothetical protein
MRRYPITGDLRQKVMVPVEVDLPSRATRGGEILSDPLLRTSVILNNNNSVIVEEEEEVHSSSKPQAAKDEVRIDNTVSRHTEEAVIQI